MKRQLDRLKGKRLVTGDPNLMTKDEICINATPNGVEVKEIGTDGKIKDLAGSGESGGDSSESTKGFQWKSAKRFWTIDRNKVNESNWNSVRSLIQMIGTYCPIYSSMLLYYNSISTESYLKLYGYCAQSNLIEYGNRNWSNRTLYFEESEMNIKIYMMEAGEIVPTFENLLSAVGIPKEMLEELGIKQISEEEYLSLTPFDYVGKELVNE